MDGRLMSLGAMVKYDEDVGGKGWEKEKNKRLWGKQGRFSHGSSGATNENEAQMVFIF